MWSYVASPERILPDNDLGGSSLGGIELISTNTHTHTYIYIYLHLYIQFYVQAGKTNEYIEYMCQYRCTDVRAGTCLSACANVDADVCTPP